MPSTILHKRNDISGFTPSVSSLSAGELAMNVSDGKLFIKTTDNTIRSFSNDSQVPYTLDQTLSSTNFQYGNNTITQVFGAVLGGYNNDISGAGSTTVNGEDNDIAGDFAFIGSGYNNSITLAGDYSAILAGSNNLISHENSFAIGSNLSSHSANFVYVNNLSASNAIYGDGSGILNVSAPTVIALVSNAESTNLVRGNVVYTFGAHGDVMSVKLASNSSDAMSSKTVGVVNETIPPNGTGYITINGSMNGLALGGFAPGDTLWLGSSPGTFTTIKPIAPQHGVYIGVVERANNGSGIAYIKIQNGYELDEIHDVLITSVSAGQILRRNPSNNLWENVNDAQKWDSVYTAVSTASANWNISYNIATAYQAVSSTFLTSETDSQTLSFNETNKELSISNSNTISLSALVDSSLDTGVRALTSDWDSTYTTVQTNSANWNAAYGSAGTDLAMRSLSANWESTYTTVQTNSASWSDIIDLAFKSAYVTYYQELNYNSITTDLSSVQIYEDNTKATHLFEKLLTYTSAALLTGISITDKVNSNTLTKTLSYDGNDNLISTTRIYT
jgi:hypothetical protein